jgi:hypothetical protein
VEAQYCQFGEVKPAAKEMLEPIVDGAVYLHAQVELIA